MKKLESQGEILIENPVPNVTVVTIVRVYSYSGSNEGLPCPNRAVPIGNMSLDRAESAARAPLPSLIDLRNSTLRYSNTARQIECRLEDDENKHLLVKGNDNRYGDAECGCPETEEVNTPSTTSEDRIIDDDVASFLEESPDLTPEQAREWAQADSQRRRNPCPPA